MPDSNPRLSDERQDPYLAELIMRCRGREHSDRRNYSQQAVAERCGISLGTYESLENGFIRTRRDYPTLLDRIANDLEMTPGERRSLFRLSGLPVPGPRVNHPPEQEELEAHRRIITALAKAAAVVDRRDNIHVANTYFQRLFPNLREGDNIARWVVQSPEAREELIDWWADWAEPALRTLKTRAAEEKDPRVIGFARELLKDFPGDKPVVGRHSPSGSLRRKYVGTHIVTVRVQAYGAVAELPSDYHVLVFEVSY